MFRSSKGSFLTVGSLTRVAVLAATALWPGVASADQPLKEVIYQGKFSCTIDTGNSCLATVDVEIPAGMILRIEYVSARITVPNDSSGPSTEFELRFQSAVDRTHVIRVAPKSVGPTVGNYHLIYAVSERVLAFAARTAAYPAPTVTLYNSKGGGKLGEGILVGYLERIN